MNKRIKAALFILFLLASFRVHAQSPKIDSLENLLKVSKDDTFRVKTLNNLSRQLVIRGNIDRAESYTSEALLLARKLNFKEGLSDADNCMGIIFKERGDYPAALKYHLLALKISEEINDKKRMASSYLNIGVLYFQKGDYPESIKNNMASLKISEETGDKHNIAMSYLNIGNVDFKQGNLEEALKGYSAALKMENELGDESAIAYAHGNIGNVYFQQNNYKEALKNYLITLDLGKKSGNKQSMANCYNNIGNIYYQQNNYTEALNNHLESLKIKDEIGDKNGMIFSYQNLAQLYISLKQLPKARDYFEQSVDLSKKIGSKDGLEFGYYHLSQMDSARGDFAKAYKNFTNYVSVKDSILNERSSKQIAKLRIEYDADKKDQQIGAQYLKLQNQRLQQKVLMTRIFYGLAISLLVIGIIILLFYLRGRRRKKEYENKLVSLELTALKSQLNPHFIFNALNSIKAYIETNPKTGSDYLTRFSGLMRGVLESSEEKEISLAEEMQLMQHYIELERLRLRHGITYSITYDESVNKEEVMIPPLITQPVIENAVWHGLGSMDREGTLHIHHHISNNTLFITVTNSAQNNLPHYVNSARRKSFGMKIMRERLALLKQTNGLEGTINFDMLPDETKVTVTIPLKETYQ